MKTYTVLTLTEVIAALRALPQESIVVGMSATVHSHRTGHDRAAVVPTDYSYRADVLADSLQSEVGRSMPSYGHGTELIDGDLPLYIAEYGEDGPAVIGFEAIGSTVETYEPVAITGYY
jgi:hypothetical protein